MECGEYPQTVVPEDFSKTLESAYFNRTINQTGKSYTTDSVKDPRTPFQARSHIEYEYNGRKYIRFVGDSNCSGEVLSDGRIIQKGVPYWIKIEPIKWMIDEKANIALSKKLIFSGVQFDRKVKYDGDFYRTDIKEFMDKHFSKDIIPSFLKKIPSEDNPYGFNFEQVSEEDIVKETIESGFALLLHSRLSVDKSAKVKQLDPDCEIIYMRNATPDSLNGKSVYNTEKGEIIDIPPTWYTNILRKCEEEPDKIHIIFFDELTNALPYVQGIIFNIVLDRKVNGIWKLPENVRIVATGNDMEESLAPNELSERLFNIFAHVYINTTIEDLLKWASENNIHPAIYSYIAYKNRELQLSEYDGKNPTADLKKWEMASKMLYKTKKPEMLRALVGDYIAREFANFCKQKAITLNDVLNNNYNFNNLQLNTAEIYATVMKLSQANEDDYEKVRDFVIKLGEEPTALFDMLWAHNDKDRLEKVSVARIRSNGKSYPYHR